MENITMIPIEHLFPHPDNPRKNLGDLSELTDSIKENGIFQNLTVVESNSGYTVIIGHRRLAASKAAGLTQLPCAIVEMTPEEQLQTMLEENMQRSDLTIVEQAEGIQMVLDLGISVADLSKRTGFSESTIRRRTKLLELDRNELEKAEGRGGTLKDYLELEKIHDPKLKNEVLQAIGTSNFNYKLNYAIETEEIIERLNKALRKVQEFAQEVPKECTKNLRYERAIYRWYSDVPIPEDDKEYFYTVSGEGTCQMRIEIYVRDEEEEESEDNTDDSFGEADEWLDNMSDEDAEQAKRFYDLRKAFIQNYPESKVGAHLRTLVKIQLLNRLDSRSEEVFEMMNVPVTEERWNKVPDEKALDKYVNQYPGKAFLMCVWGMLDREDRGCISYDYDTDEQNTVLFSYRDYDFNPLKKTYKLMTELGYKMCDEEKAYMDGTALNNYMQEFMNQFPKWQAKLEEEDE